MDASWNLPSAVAAARERAIDRNGSIFRPACVEAIDKCLRPKQLGRDLGDIVDPDAVSTAGVSVVGCSEDVHRVRQARHRRVARSIYIAVQHPLSMGAEASHRNENEPP
jgi:hypothetical protein